MTEKTKEEKEEVSFDLPDVSEDKAVKPRIHVAPGDSACESCEG